MRRTQYLIHLTPEKKLLESLYALKHTLSDNLILKDTSLDFHTTIIGFYSKSEKLGFNSREDLELEIVNAFKHLQIKPAPTLIKNVNMYSSKLVLELGSQELHKIHYDTLTVFKPFMVLKGNILPTENPEYFHKRYAFSFDKYSPHITICDVNSADAIKYFHPLIGREFYFNKISLSRKSTNAWKDLCVLFI